MKTLLAVTAALACNTIEPLHFYKAKKDEDAKWGLHRAEWILPMDLGPCERLFRGQSVEIVEKVPDYPFIVKIHWSEPDRVVFDERNNPIAKGVVHDEYALAEDFAAEVPPLYPISKPSKEVLERRERIKELRRTWGLRAPTVFVEE